MEIKKEFEDWKKRLIELEPVVKKQLDWLEQGSVQPRVKDGVNGKKYELASRLVDLQEKHGEYTRNQISNQDVERIKRISKTDNCSFEQAIESIVENSRYVSKEIIEARGVIDFILEIQRVYDEISKNTGVFPINAMSAESKRSCRNQKIGLTIEEKVRAIIEVYLPEMGSIHIVERDTSVIPQGIQELPDTIIIEMMNYFKTHAKQGKIDNCFDNENKKEFLEICDILAKAGMTVQQFLDKYKFLTNNKSLTYSKCYSAQIIPTVKKMILAYKKRNNSTVGIDDRDPYLRHKIETLENFVGVFNIKDLLQFLFIDSDNEGYGRPTLQIEELKNREICFFYTLENLYPNKQIPEDFINTQPELYNMLRFLADRLCCGDKDAYLKNFGFTRMSSHARQQHNVIYLSEADLKFYEIEDVDHASCGIHELDPKDFFETYNKLISLGKDSTEVRERYQRGLIM